MTIETRTNSMGNSDKVAIVCRFLAMRMKGKLKGSGLSGKRIGAGCYRFSRSDGRPLNSIVALVNLAEPWASEMTTYPIVVCAKHGFKCPHDPMTPPCEMKEKLMEVPRWKSFIRLIDSKHFEANLIRLPRVKILRKTRLNPIPHDADFFVELISNAP